MVAILPDMDQEMSDDGSVINMTEKKGTIRKAIDSIRPLKSKISTLGILSNRIKDDDPIPEEQYEGFEPRKSTDTYFSSSRGGSVRALFGSIRSSTESSRRRSTSSSAIRPRVSVTFDRGSSYWSDSVRNIKDRIKRKTSRMDDFGIIRRTSSPLPEGSSPIPIPKGRRRTDPLMAVYSTSPLRPLTGRPSAHALRPSRSFRHFFRDKEVKEKELKEIAFRRYQDRVSVDDQHAVPGRRTPSEGVGEVYQYTEYSPMPGTNQQMEDIGLPSSSDATRPHVTFAQDASDDPFVAALKVVPATRHRRRPEPCACEHAVAGSNESLIAENQLSINKYTKPSSHQLPVTVPGSINTATVRRVSSDSSGSSYGDPMVKSIHATVTGKGHPEQLADAETAPPIGTATSKWSDDEVSHKTLVVKEGFNEPHSEEAARISALPPIDKAKRRVTEEFSLVTINGNTYQVTRVYTSGIFFGASYHTVNVKPRARHDSAFGSVDCTAPSGATLNRVATQAMSPTNQSAADASDNCPNANSNEDHGQEHQISPSNTNDIINSLDTQALAGSCIPSALSTPSLVAEEERLVCDGYYALQRVGANEHFSHSTPNTSRTASIYTDSCRDENDVPPSVPARHPSRPSPYNRRVSNSVD